MNYFHWLPGAGLNFQWSILRKLLQRLKDELFPQPDLVDNQVKKLKSNEEVIAAVNEYFEGLDESDYKNGVTALEPHSEKM